jgi:GNAT superfamily N-acetyltransferase
MSVVTGNIKRVDREQVQQWLPLLDSWLLQGAVYGVQHTWPQLYRADGQGSFFAILDGDELLSHCACRVEELRDGDRIQRVGLIGSVATAPDRRGRGLAGQVLHAAIASMECEVDNILLWAERPELYAQQGFVKTGEDSCLMLARRPIRNQQFVRPLEITDHAQVHALHQSKPRRISRSVRTMSTLLTTPGMNTLVLERGGQVVAYACTGKGADLHGYWHELGGSDEDLAILIPTAMHMTDQVEAALLLPPYRPRLGDLLAQDTIDTVAVAGPMIRPGSDPVRSCWIDGLDSV